MRGLMILMAVVASFASSQAQNIKVYFDGKSVSLRDPAIMRNGRTLMGLRETFDRLGAVVFYETSTRRITAWRGERTIVIEIGKSAASIDDQTIFMDQPPIVEGSTTYVPLRFLAEALAAKVKFVASSNSVYIDTEAMGFFDEKAPFRVGDNVLYLFRNEWHPARITKVMDHESTEDLYQIQFEEPNGRMTSPCVGRRYLRFPTR